MQHFTLKISNDLKMHFAIVDIRGEMLYTDNGTVDVSIPIKTIYQEYRFKENYKETLMQYIEIIKEILGQYKFIIDYSNVYPILENNNFGRNENICFYREPFVLDLNWLFVSDMGQTFRYVLSNDNVDFNKLTTSAWSNLNKMTNVLEKLDETLHIYSFAFNSDYASSLLFSSSIKKQIRDKLGDDYIFAIPAATCVIVAKYRPSYINIIKPLMRSTTDPHKISGRIYRCRKGNYEYVDDSPKLRLIK